MDDASRTSDPEGPVERRLRRASAIAVLAIQTLRVAISHADPGRVVSLIDEVDSFFALIDGVESSATLARATLDPHLAVEHAEDAFSLAIAARREARKRARALHAALGQSVSSPVPS